MAEAPPAPPTHTEVEEAQRTVNALQAVESSAALEGRGHGNAKGTLTFSGPPHVPRAVPHPRRNQTFSPDNLREIQRENQILVQRISQISARKNGFADDKPWSSAAPKSSQQSSAEINRRRQAEKIAKDNLAMFKRLQSIKPSSDISRQRLDREHQLNRKYMEMHRTVKAPAAAPVASEER